MGEIRPRSASLATLFALSLCFILSTAYLFSGTNDSELTALYGAGLLVLVTLATITGLTAITASEVWIRTWCLCAGAYWAARGTYHLVQGLYEISDTNFQYGLFSGLGGFVVIFFIFSVCAQIQGRSHIALLSFTMVIACAFEIGSLWYDIRLAVGASYIMPSALMNFMVMKILTSNLSSRLRKDEEKNEASSGDLSQLYMIVGQVSTAISFAVYANQVVTPSVMTSYSFMWLVTSAVTMLLCSIIALRNQDTVFGSFYGLSGAFWISVAFGEIIGFATSTGIWPLLATADSVSVIAVYVFCSIAFFILSVAFFNRQILQSAQCLLLCLFAIGMCQNIAFVTYRNVIGWMGFILALYGIIAHLLSGTTKLSIPIGINFFKTNLGKSVYAKTPMNLHKFVRKSNTEGNASSDAMLGYSKYADVDLVGFGANAMAALSILWVPADSLVFSLPWVVGVGGGLQFLAGCVGYSRGKTFESCSFLIYSIFWALWGSIRCIGINNEADSIEMSLGCIAFLVIGVAMSFISMSINKVWTVISIMFDLLVLCFLLHTMKVPSIDVFEQVVLFIFALTCLYCFVASSIKAIWKRELLSLGRPILPLSYLHTQANDAVWMDAKKTSGVKTIADTLKDGGVCGIPTDTVYVLTAACNRPQGVERAYNTKKLAEDRPMSMWISKVSQLEAGREEFGELLWELMNEIWPSTISLVVKKGPWLQSLGLDFAEKYIGKPDSIAVRMPDNTMTLSLIDQTGPLAITSANPTGEADTTHHLQVLAKLGVKNCDGILCDGPSFENAASTVVDCRNITDGKLGFFRVGIVPRSTVEGIFEKVQSAVNGDNPRPHRRSRRVSLRQRLSWKLSKKARTEKVGISNIGFDHMEEEEVEPAEMNRINSQISTARMNSITESIETKIDEDNHDPIPDNIICSERL